MMKKIFVIALLSVLSVRPCAVPVDRLSDSFEEFFRQFPATQPDPSVDPYEDWAGADYVPLVVLPIKRARCIVDIGQIPPACFKGPILTLDLQGQNIGEIAGPVFEQIARAYPALRVLDLSKNPLVALPEEIKLFQEVTHLLIDDTLVGALPDTISFMRNLRQLCASRTKITTLPKSLGALDFLQALFLDESALAYLPEGFRWPGNLRVLSLEETPLSRRPDWSSVYDVIKMMLARHGAGRG